MKWSPQMQWSNLWRRDSESLSEITEVVLLFGMAKKSFWEIFSKIFCEEWCLIIKLNVFLDLGYKSIFDSIIIKFIMLKNLVWVLLEKCNNSLTVLLLPLFSNFNYYRLSFKKIHACGCIWVWASVSTRVFRVWKGTLVPLKHNSQLWGALCGCWEHNWGPLQERYVS